MVKCYDHGSGPGVGLICSLSFSSVRFQIHFSRTLLIDFLGHHLEEREKTY